MKQVRSSADELTPIDAWTGPVPWIAETLRQGQCPSDRAFDSFLPEDLKSASSEY